jgi:MFS family permease
MSDVTLGVIETKIPSRLDRLPWSRFHWRIVIGLGTAWVLDGLEVTIVGSVASRLTSHGSGVVISAAGIGVAASLYVAGACLGALVFGHLTDRFGRKKLFLVTLALYMVATAVTGLSFSAWFFFVFRFFTGAGIGGEYAAINSAIDELIPARARGRVDLVINGSYWIGSIFGSALSIFFLDTAIFPRDIGWRLTFALGVILAAAVMLVRRHVPESPRWLFIHGREEEAEALVDQIEHDVRERTGTELAPVRRSLTVRQRRTIGFRSIVRTAVKEYPKRSILCIALFVGQAFIYNGITFNLGTLMTKFFHVSTTVVPVFLILYAAANFLGPLLLGRLFDTVGRVPMITATYLGSSVLGILLAALFAETGVFGSWSFIATVMVTFFLASAGASAAYLTSSEIFPMETRALAIAFFYAIGTAVGGIAGPLLFGPLITTGSRRLVGLAFFIGSLLMIGGAVAEITFGVRAERQQLEDIATPLTVQGEEEAGEPTEAQGARWAAADHRARAAEHRAAAAEHRARLHEMLAGVVRADDGNVEVEDVLAQVEDARALAEDERAAAADARDGRRDGEEPAGRTEGGAQLEGGSSGEPEPSLDAVRAAELRARSHDEEAQALLAGDERESERHRRLSGAALERARAAEQWARAAPDGEGATDGTDGDHEEEPGEAHPEGPRRSLDAAMHGAWAEMHDHRARALELRSTARTGAALDEERLADAAAERARAISFRADASEHRAHAESDREELAEECERARDRWEQCMRTQARTDDDRIRERVARRRTREAVGMRRYRPGPGRLGRAPGTTAPSATEEELEHEVLSIERALYDHGPTDRRELFRMVGARYWGPGAFARALRESVTDGAVRRLSRRVYAPAAAGEGVDPRDRGDGARRVGGGGGPDTDD